MNEIDKQLYDFLLRNITSITDKWLNTRKVEEGSIYSADTNMNVVQMLREQNTLTNKTAMSALLNDQAVVDNYINEWVHVVSESRVKTDTPLHEVIHAINNAKEIFFEYTYSFIHVNEDQITKDDIIRWLNLFNNVFNKLTTLYSEMHYTLTKQRLSSQQDLINELSTPVIPISDRIAILPLNGNVDRLRMKHLYETVPEKVVESHVEYLFIDLSGIPFLDSNLANDLCQVIYLLQVLGITTAISGVKPEVAQSIVQYQNNFKEIPTFSTLKQALKIILTPEKDLDIKSR
ncbi:STAS domain-containing protein [Paucisalibacillus sp. EB02]|uniref:STAS domain-containing protein n=1 Tax=Paucisalibacillus sp. EB02 TaxID=1347087 RepID=UPI0004B32A9D|nr:STAS domain-containing protein [Paucisalibacillus sp. EB02]